MKAESAARVYVNLTEPKKGLWQATACAVADGEALATRYGDNPLVATEAARTAAVLVLGERKWRAVQFDPKERTL